MWIFFGTKYKGLLLYIVSWFVGLGVVTAFFYALQIFVFGISKWEYFMLLVVLILSFFIKLFLSKYSIKKYFSTLCLDISFSPIRESFLALSRVKKIFSLTFFGYILVFLLLSLLYNISFPTYFDDSFGNWTLGAINMYFDGGYRVFGSEDEILGKGGRTNYPIFVSIFRALVADFSGFWYEIYQNLFQYVSFFFTVMFTFVISFKKTKDIFVSLLPPFFITSIPLVFFHITDGYMDLASGLYSVFTIYFLYRFLSKKNYENFVLGALFGALLIGTKNDALVVYLPGIVFGFIIYLFLNKEISDFFRGLCTRNNITRLGFIVLFFLAPQFFVRFYHGLALNPQANDGFENPAWWHLEIFTYADDIFILENNYNLILLLIPLLFLGFWKGKKSFILYSVIFIFAIFIAVFLFTSNYRWVLDQTTVNRAFMSCFVILVSFFALIYSDKKQK
ncbi:hypothetical protein MK079_00850 [Candidatus Gracilibacteria bacterium]|nr:hypothetical protein [Candidatus Gracilibacteria bacterium]